ncbi:MAG: response regulator [Treponema sp.]|nr:response regulator [Treponema sp.]
MANLTDEKKRILVVDDDEAQLGFVKAILKSDYEVVSVTSGNDAFERLSQGFVPNLILLDVLMPELDGFDTYGKIQAMDPLRNVPVIFLTAVNSPDEIQRALKFGAIDYITKPYAMENFKNRIKNAIEISEYKRR